MQIGYIGLGKMGLNMTLRLKEKGYEVVAYDIAESARKRAEEASIPVVPSLEDLVKKFSSPRLLWIMVPHKFVGETVDKLSLLLSRSDTICDGGNSFFKKSIENARKLKEKEVGFLDVGVSGGPEGAKNGTCLMVGGKKDLFLQYESLFRDIAKENGYGYMGNSGAGHFVKMVHNGIEYGMMQSIAEGFSVMKESDFSLDLKEVARVYNNGSVIESRLIGWLGSAFSEHGENLEDISELVAHSGEGEWTVDTARELNVPVRIIEESLLFRKGSAEKPSFTGRILSALRNQFGGHDVKN